MTPAQQKLGLALSGGGYRAAAFHLGILEKLHQMQLLQEVDVISTISGGSITGAYYCLEKDDFTKFSSTLYNALQEKSVISKVFLSFTFLKLLLFAAVFIITAFYFLFFTSLPWLFLLVMTIFIFLLLKFQFQIFNVSSRIEDIYDHFFFNNKKMDELPIHPKLVIGSTNLETARPFIFSKTWMQDSTYQFLKPPIQFKAAKFPVSRAVMASSCIPFAFSPIQIDRQFFVKEEDAKRVHPQLVDGGVFDNQGGHRIVQDTDDECSHIIVGDAGGAASGELSFRNTISLLITTVDVFMARIKNVQMVSEIYENAKTRKKEIAFISLGWDIEKLISGFIDNLASDKITQSVIDAHDFDPEWLKNIKLFRPKITEYLETKTGYNQIEKPSEKEREIARNVGTNLKSLPKEQIDALLKQAACITELQVKLYCPSIIKTS